MLAAAIKGNWSGARLYVSGKSAGQNHFAAQLGAALGGRVEVERLNVPNGEGRSAAILGLKQACEQSGDAPILIIQAKESKGIINLAQRKPWEWAAAAALLVLAALMFPYLEAVLLKPRLARKLAEIEHARDKMAAIDQELNFPSMPQD